MLGEGCGSPIFLHHSRVRAFLQRETWSKWSFLALCHWRNSHFLVLRHPNTLGAKHRFCYLLFCFVITTQRNWVERQVSLLFFFTKINISHPFRYFKASEYFIFFAKRSWTGADIRESRVSRRSSPFNHDWLIGCKPMFAVSVVITAVFCTCSVRRVAVVLTGRLVMSKFQQVVVPVTSWLRIRIRIFEIDGLSHHLRMSQDVAIVRSMFKPSKRGSDTLMLVFFFFGGGYPSSSLSC